MFHAVVSHPPIAKREAEDAMALACGQYWITNFKFDSNIPLVSKGFA
jgi:hypothetical protein